MTLGTCIALAFPRSPMVTAQIAWDLAAQSKGRFILGLGTQIKIYIVKRFSALWVDKPVTQLREYIESMRAIWKAFQDQEQPALSRRQSITLACCRPSSIQARLSIPISRSISRVSMKACANWAAKWRTAFTSIPSTRCATLQDVIRPAVAEGAQEAERTPQDIALSCAVFVVTGRDAEDIERNTIEIKSQIAFYASTPSYKARPLDLHGWGDFGERMNQMTKESKWNDMWREVPDEILHEFAVVAPPDELPYKVRERYNGLLDRVGYYFPFKPDDESRRVIWEEASKAMSSQAAS